MVPNALTAHAHRLSRGKKSTALSFARHAQVTMRVGRFIIITVLSLIHHAGGKIDALQKKRSVGVIPGDDALEKLRQIRERASPSEVNDEETDGAVKSKTKKHTAGATAAKPPPQAWEDLVKAPIKDSVNKAAIPDEYRSAAAAESVKAILSAVTAKTGIDTAIPGAASVSSVGVPRAREACYPCPQSALADPATAAIRFFWEDNLLDANSCACSTLKTKGDDAAVRIAKAVYAATLKFAQSLAAEAGDGPDLQPVDLQGRSALLPLWELLAPFPSGRQNIDGGKSLNALLAFLSC